MTKPKDDLDAVREIADTLKDFDSADRKRIIRWVMEKLGDTTSNIKLGITPHIVQESTVANKSPLQETSNPVDIKMFIEDKAPKSANQLAAVIAYYYAFEAPKGKRKDSIGSADLLEAIRQSRRRRPGRPLQALINAKNVGLLDPSGEKGKFKVSSVGENLVAMVLPNQSSKKSKTKQKIKKRKKKSTRKQ